MRTARTFLLLALLSFSARADLIITEVMPSSSHTNTVANGDWWELYNSGASAIDLTTYSWDDNTATPGSADFNGLTINAGEAIIIGQETVGQEAAWLAAWALSGVTVINLGNTEFQNFGAGGDEIHVYDTLNVQVAAVTFGAATAGFSFEWDASGNSLGLSVNGENGAFLADASAGGGPDVGSPGTVIPEPCTMALLSFGAVLLCGRRFRSRAQVQA